jgi:hypothetical protein
MSRWDLSILAFLKIQFGRSLKKYAGLLYSEHAQPIGGNNR